MKKVLFTVISCFVLLLAMPEDVNAAAGHKANGSTMQQDAYELSLEKMYYDHGSDNEGKFYKFKTGTQEGLYLLSLQTVVMDAQNTTNKCTSYVKVVDRYGTIVSAAQAGGNAGDYRNAYDGTKPGRAMDIILPVEGLSADTYYYICLVPNDGNKNAALDIVNSFEVDFVPFRAADNFNMKYGTNGELEFSWSNSQSYNTYNPLTPYDGFQIELSQGKQVRRQYAGNGGTTSYKIAANNADLKALGYPKNSITVKLGCIQTYHSLFNESKSVDKCVYATSIFTTKSLNKKAESSVSGLRYKITNPKSNGNGTVSVVGIAGDTPKKVVISDKVKINGITYKVTAIEKNAFANNKKITEVEIGKNIRAIRNKAFFGCTKLKKVTIKSKVLKKVEKDAFTNMDPKGTIKVPKSKLASYKRLFDKKYTKGVVIK